MAAFFIAVWAAVLAACLAAVVRDPGPDLRHPAVAGSAAATVGWMLLAWAGMPAATRFARLAWTLGFLTLLAHIAIAFGVGHGWSHAAAVEHVREVGGYGEGIAVNYLFAAVWAVDVVWWWADPAGRARRPRWVGWAVHGFLAFVVLNATVVFGPAGRRVWYAAALGCLAGWAVTRRRTGAGP
ncbi:MAG: hypothetical protein C0501_03135 [Isosphaera sp.]|nr:hypothetical protein [Isosphaera sp.]